MCEGLAWPPGTEVEPADDDEMGGAPALDAAEFVAGTTGTADT
jgi:hypothetical protein